MPWLDPIIALQRGLNVLAAVSKGMQDPTGLLLVLCHSLEA
jgi:hypothetical protein